MVARRAGEGSALDIEPQFSKGALFGKVAGDDASLGAKKSLVGASGNNVSPLFEGHLEDSIKPQDMGHVIHDHRSKSPVFDQIIDKSDRLRIEKHAFPEDEEIGLVLFEKLFEPFKVRLVRIFRVNREIDDIFLAGLRILLHIIKKRAHGL